MAGLFLAMGVYTIFFLPKELNVPDKFRMMFGSVLMLYGIYRIISTRIKQRHQEDEERQNL